MTLLISGILPTASLYPYQWHYSTKSQHC